MSETIHYLSYEPDSMWEAMMEAYQQAGGELLFPGDEKELLLRSVQAVLISAYAAHDTCAKQRTLRFATGAYLDLLGENKGVPRIAAAHASADAQVTLYGVGTLTLPKDTLFTQDGSIFYATQNTVIVASSGGEVSTTVTLVCTEGGVLGNGIPEGMELTPVTVSRDVVSAVLLTQTSGGREAEDDEAYRERIRFASLRTATTGPKLAYEAKAKAVSTAILDASAAENETAVAVWLLFDAGAGEEERNSIMVAVLEALNAETERPLTDLVTVAQGEAVPYAIVGTYRLPENAADDVAVAVAAASAAYKLEQESKLGKPFDPYVLMAKLYGAGATRVVFDGASHVDGEPLDYTEILESQYMSGSITLTPEVS
jgi:phage-related baseplate assembly protein